MGEQVRLIMLVGLAGSGKSTVAKELVEEELMKGRDNIVIISSDQIRKDLFGDEGHQEKNGEVFAEMAKLTNEALKNGLNVIYDATNLSRKRRKGFLSQLPKKLDIEKIAIYMATPIHIVKQQNANRERVVPTHVIDRMYKTLQIPVYGEGWDKIIYEYDEETIQNDLQKQFTDSVRAGVLFEREGYGVMGFLASYFHDEFFHIHDLPHDSKYHNFSVSRHIYYVYKHILDTYEGEDKELMLWAGLTHDIGKHFCKSFVNYKGEETVYANFIGHELVGSQMAVPFLKRMNFGDEFIEKVVTLIQFHMYLLDSKASKEKLIGLVGQDIFDKLEILRDADTIGH